MSEKIELTLPLLKKGGKEFTGIRRLQELVNFYVAANVGGKQLVVDGDFGAKTEEAVRSVQRNVGLTVDGIAGSRTWTFLLSNWLSNSLD